jgi:signal transduction histidine kinase
MDFGAPTTFVIGVTIIITIGFALPLRIEGGEDYLSAAYGATVAGAIVGPRGIVLVWLAVVCATPLLFLRHLVTAGGPRAAVRPTLASLGYSSLTALAVSAGYVTGHTVYLFVFEGEFPMRLETRDQIMQATVSGFAAWVGTMGLRAVSLRVLTGSILRRALDPFDSVLIPYVLPVIGGLPLVVATMALYDPADPWKSLLALSWCFPLYWASWYELHRRSLALELRREVLARQRLAAIGEVSARIVHQSRHQVGLMGWSIHRLRGLLGASEEAQVQAARDELDALDAAKDRLSQMLASELLHEAEPPDDESPRPVRVTTYADAIDDVVRQLNEDASASGVRLEAVVDTELGARWTASSVRDVVFNLVDNAIDAAASCVEVRLGRAGDSWEAETELRVTDDGPGMGEREVERSFEPFFTTKPDGTGMGLAIAEALVGELGGSLRYERIGSRTAFVVTLPPPQAGTAEIC